MVTDCCKFLIGKAAGCSASEPIRSLVKASKETQTSLGVRECRSPSILKTEPVGGVFRGSRGSMQWKIINTVLEIQYSDNDRSQPMCIRQRNHTGLYWKSEESIVPHEGMGQHNPSRGKGLYFVNAFNERKVKGLQRC